MKYGILIFFAAGGLLGTLDEAAAAVSRFRFGGRGGAAWEELTDLNVMMDVSNVPGALQPLELKPDENVVPRLGAWMLYKKPLDFHYHSGVPRIWRGEGFATPGENNPLTFVDGDPETFYADTGFNKVSTEFYTLDLGGQVPAERFVFYPPEGQDPFTGEPYRPNYALKGFELSAENDAEKVRREEGTEYRPLGILLAHVGQNFDPVVEVRFQSQYLRFFRLKAFPDDVIERWGNRPVIRRHAMAEMEVYGRGFVPRATWESQVVDLGDKVNFGRVFIAASQWRREGAQLVSAPEAPVEVRVEVKTGLDDSPIVYHGYNDMGMPVEVSETEYERLKARVFPWDPAVVGWRGPIAEDRQHWSSWSAPVRVPGERPRVPRGQYMQVRVVLDTDALWAFARVDSLAVEVSPLLADRVVGEVAAADDLHPEGGLVQVQAGALTEFVYDLKAEFSGVGQPGFDAVRFLAVSGEALRGLEMGSPLTPVLPDSVVEAAEGLVVYLPQRVTRDGQRLRLRLETAVYGAAEELGAEVFERVGEHLPQGVEAGDVSAELGTDRLRVMVQASSLQEVLGSLEVAPGVFTPQGDGTNERVRLQYTLFRVLEGVVEVGVYTLGGERVRRLQAGTESAGPHVVEWDGRDEQDRLVAPGLYLVQVAVETDRGRFARTRPVAIAY